MLRVCQQDLERMAQLKDTAVADRLELQTRASEQQDRLRALDQTVAYLTGQVSSKYAQSSKMYIACICRTDPGGSKFCPLCPMSLHERWQDTDIS